MLERILPLLHQVGKCLFFCTHPRIAVSEGKCYCPDCGQGLIYQWVLLRCQQCNGRRDSRYLLRQVLPRYRHCLQCGEADWRLDHLESPAYFQLHQARLIIQESMVPFPKDSLFVTIYSWAGQAFSPQPHQFPSTKMKIGLEVRGLLG
jgi:uncharacterized protein (DUF983 family)